jgi:hypothetical protein
MINLMLAAILICGVTTFTSCTNEDNPVDPAANLSEKIIGKWMEADINGQPVLTNEKKVYAFLSTTKGYMSASLNARPEMGSHWLDRLDFDVVIDGSKMTLTIHTDEHITVVEEYIVTAINGSELTAKCKVTVTVDGSVTTSGEYNIRYVKVTTDYSEDIIGLWRGYVTSEEGSEFDDGEEHQWEYKNDGTYVYYIQDDDDNWIANPGQTLSEYFVDGTLLCTRWVNGGVENREWWEIESIKGGVMKWKALRQKEDGSTYTATFAMLRVKQD